LSNHTTTANFRNLKRAYPLSEGQLDPEPDRGKLVSLGRNPLISLLDPPSSTLDTSDEDRMTWQGQFPSSSAMFPNPSIPDNSPLRMTFDNQRHYTLSDISQTAPTTVPLRRSSCKPKPVHIYDPSDTQCVGALPFTVVAC